MTYKDDVFAEALWQKYEFIKHYRSPLSVVILEFVHTLVILLLAVASYKEKIPCPKHFS